jgi:HSP20 family protein
MLRRKKDTEDLVPIDASRTMSPSDDLERWFEDAFRSPVSWFRRPFPTKFFSGVEETTPSVDIFEEGDELVLKAELPGMEKDDVRVNLSDNILTISGEKKREEKVERSNYFRLERSEGSFTRSFRLPLDVEAGKAKATFKKGILEMRIPKTEEAKKKVIEVKID